MMMMFNPYGNNVASCPLCQQKGILKFVVPVLRDKVFKYEVEIDDCPLCDGDAFVEIKDDKDDDRRTGNPEGNIHTRGSSFL